MTLSFIISCVPLVASEQSSSGHLSFSEALAQEVRPWEQYLNEVMTQEDMASSTWE